LANGITVSPMPEVRAMNQDEEVTIPIPTFGGDNAYDATTELDRSRLETRDERAPRRSGSRRYASQSAA